MADGDHPDEDEHGDLASKIDGLETKLDRLALLVVALLVLQLASLGGDLFVNLGLIAVGLGVVGFVAVFLVALGKRL